jgi:hypothetical protein
MNTMRRRTVHQWLTAALLPPALSGVPILGRAQADTLTDELRALPPGATLHKVTAVPVAYRSRRAIKVEFTEAAMSAERGVSVDNPTFVLIPGRFQDGTIEVDLLGRLNGKGPADARAFVGLAYRVVDPDARFESVYLRPLNGRKKSPPAPRDRRAVQYFAYPDWKFPRLREQYPDGRYEAGADIGDDEWIRLKLDIDGTRVTVSVDGKVELALAETKATPAPGGIGLWVGIGAEGYFANLRVTPR